MGDAAEIIEGSAVQVAQPTRTAITPDHMLNQAIAQGAGVEVMEKLMTLHARWETMQARKAFDNAMAQLRENMPEVIKNQTVDFTSSKGRTNYKYEDLSDVTKALSPVMSSVGLSFRWRTESSPQGVAVTCIISHRDGHSEETTLSCGMDNSGNKNAIQALGSAVTYLQRYTLKAAVGVAAAHDDDGNKAAKRPDEKQPEQPKNQRQSKADSRAVYDRLSKANHDLKTLEKFDKFWSQQNVTDAFNSLPADWSRDLTTEKNDKQKDLESSSQGKEADPFPGDT